MHLFRWNIKAVLTESDGGTQLGNQLLELVSGDNKPLVKINIQVTHCSYVHKLSYGGKGKNIKHFIW